MTVSADMGPEPRVLPSLREAGLWLGAALLVLATHATIAYAVHALRPAAPPAEAFEPALMIDLTPLAVSTPESIEFDTLTAERPTEIVQPVETPSRLPSKQWSRKRLRL